jgi:divalent metal cation (Fe/Co/Zn/Cd) transporter
VVLVGLGLVWAAGRLGAPWLIKADAVTALGVAGIVVWISVQLGKRSVAVLLDAAPSGKQEAIEARLSGLPGVQKVERVRIRSSGPEAFADITLDIGRDTALPRAHEIAAQAEAVVRDELPGADVVVQFNPVRAVDEGVLAQVRILAAQHGIGAHGIRIYDNGRQRTLELHLEVNDALRVNEAHALADGFETELRKIMPDLADVVTHIEPTGDASVAQSVRQVAEAQVLAVLNGLPRQLGVDFRPHEVQMRHAGSEVAVSFHCIAPGESAITDAHELTVRIEQALRAQLPGLGRVLIHVEPPDEGRSH